MQTVEKHITRSRAMDASGMPVIPTTDQPAAACHCDSARVEKRGPLITTSVPPSTAAGLAARNAARPRGQYGSANEVCTTGPMASQMVWARPQVRSTTWSGTTNVPAARSARSPPTAQGASTWRTPTERSAHRLAR